MVELKVIPTLLLIGLTCRRQDNSRACKVMRQVILLSFGILVRAEINEIVFTHSVEAVSVLKVHGEGVLLIHNRLVAVKSALRNSMTDHLVSG